MKYKVTDYYLALLLSISYRKRSSLPKIPPDIVRYIFYFIGPKQIMNNLNDQNLLTLYDRQSPEKSLYFHPFHYLPYPNIITIEEIIAKFITLAKEKKHNIRFSHLCCSGKGCVFNTRKEC